MGALGLLAGAALVLIGAHQVASPVAHLARGVVPAVNPETVRRVGGLVMAAGALIFIFTFLRVAQG